MIRLQFKRWRLVLAVGATVLLTACLSVRYDVDRVTDQRQMINDRRTSEHFDRLYDLTQRILELSPYVDEDEAALVANTALVYPMQLAERYELTRPPYTHNIMVNWGIKPRGLCIHWTEDLLTELKGLQLDTLDLYWGVAYPTRKFRLEHSTAVVTARGEPFETGVILDAWRDSGKLFYAKIGEDKRYNWQRLHNYITDPPPPSPETVATP